MTREQQIELISARNKLYASTGSLLQLRGQLLEISTSIESGVSDVLDYYKQLERMAAASGFDIRDIDHDLRMKPKET